MNSTNTNIRGRDFINFLGMQEAPEESKRQDYMRRVLGLLGPPNDKSQPGINTITESVDNIKVDIAKPQPTSTETRQAPPARKYPDISRLAPFFVGPGGIDPANLSGLTPEQMMNVMQVGMQREELARKSVADILGAMGAEEELAGRAARQRALAWRTMHPEVEYGLKMDLERIKKSKSREKVELLKAKTDAAAAAGRLSNEKANRIIRLLGEEEKALQTGNELRAREIEELLDIEITEEGIHVPDQPGVMRARDIASAIAREAKVPSDLPERKFTAARAKDMAVIESEMIADPTGAKALGHYQRFNVEADTPYVYLPGMLDIAWGRDKPGVKKIPLPVVNGVQITARMVSEAAKNANMSLEDYLRNRLKMKF